MSKEGMSKMAQRRMAITVFFPHRTQAQIHNQRGLPELVAVSLAKLSWCCCPALPSLAYPAQSRGGIHYSHSQ